MDPVNTVFRNDLLMDNILKHFINIGYHPRSFQISKNKIKSFLDHLHLRVVSRSFNEAVTRHVQRQFSQFTIGYRRNDFFENVDLMAVSNYCIPTAKTRRFFEFLSKAMKVKVRSIEVIDILRSKGLCKRLHSEIWESLVGDNYGALTCVTGMEEICTQNCVHCLRVATQCRKYGPLQEHVLRNAFNEKTHHFETLIVSDRLLNQIAVQCSVTSDTKEACLAALEEMVHSRLSCSHLIFMVEEKPYKREFRHSPLLSVTQALPREVIDRMLSAWGVKSVEIRFHSNFCFSKIRASANKANSYEFREPIYSSVWTEKGFLTPVQFDGDFRAYKHSNLRFDHVTVNLESAYFAMFPYLHRDQTESSGYFNAVSIVHRLFPSSRMRLELSRGLPDYNKYRLKDMREIIELFKRVCWQEDPSNVHIDVVLLSKVCGHIVNQRHMNYSDFNVEKGVVNVYDEPAIHFEDFKKYPIFSKTFKVIESDKKRSIFIEAFIRGDEIYLSQNMIREHRNEISDIMWDFLYAYHKWKRS